MPTVQAIEGQIQPRPESRWLSTSMIDYFQQWFIPTLAMMAAIATAHYFVFTIEGYHRFFADSDAGRHLRIGEWILSHRQIPIADIDTFTYFGRPWYDWEWLADVFTAFVYRLTGLPGVTLLYGAAIGGCLYLSVRLTLVVRGTLLPLLLLAPFVIQILAIHTLARPHVFSWLFLVGTVLLFEHIDGQLSRQNAFLLFVIGVIWANAHASFFLGPVIAIVYTASRLLSRWLWDDSHGAALRPLVLATALTIAAGFFNPYGWQLHRHVFDFLSDPQMTNKVSEYQSFDFRSNGANAVTLALTLTVVGATLSVLQKRLDHALLMMLFCWQALSTVRMLPLLVLVALPLANGAISEQLRSVRGIRPSVRGLIEKAIGLGDDMRQMDRRAGGLCFALIVLLFAASVLNREPALSRTGFSPVDHPVVASAAIAKLPPKVRLFSTDAYGSYLTYRFEGKYKVFVDGRTDLYAYSFLNDYGKMMRLDNGWEKIWDSWHFSHALLPSRARLLESALEGKGWRAVHRDKTATLLSAPAKVRDVVDHQR